MGDLSATTIAALAAAAVLVIGAFFTGVVNVIMAWRTMAGKVSAIEGHVNSEKTAAEGRENTLKKENALLREILSDQKMDKALLAQSVSTSAAAVAASAAAVAVYPAPSASNLNAKIETNTRETAENTKRTDENVKDLKAQS